jgi:hypothetical protein
MAQENPSQPFYDFMYGKFLLKDYFGIVLHNDDYVEHAYNIWRDIGNIAVSVHAFKFEVPSSCIVMLPCNAEFVESVTDGSSWDEGYSDYYTVYDSGWNANPNSFLADAIVRNNSRTQLDAQKSQLHGDGGFIPYELRGTFGYLQLHFEEKYAGCTGVCIYRGICVDEDGNPLLARKEAEAIAYKLAFIKLQKRVWMQDQAALQIMTSMNVPSESGRKMAAAKIPEYVSQNQWNRVLSAMTSHNRKVFYSSYKTMQ